MTEVRNYLTSTYASPNPEYFGKGKGMNVIYIHLESFQNFLIDYKLNGQEVTPFLNSFKKMRIRFILITSSIKQDKGKRLMRSLC